MPNSINKTPTLSTLSSYASGESVAATKTKRWVDELDYLLGFNLPTVCSTQFQEFNTETSVSSGTTYLSYWKSPGAKIVCFEVEIQRDNTATQFEAGSSSRTCYVDITLPTGAVWLSGSLFDASVTSTERELTYPRITNGQYQVYRAFADVTNVVSSSIQTMTASYTNTESATSKGHGFERINIIEIPRTTFFDSSTDNAGVKEEWARPTQPIIETSSDGTFGIVPIIKNLDRARYQVRNQFQLSSLKDSTPSRLWKGTYGVDTDLDYRQTLTTPRRYMIHRVRTLYGAGNTVPYKVRVVYSTNDTAYIYRLSINWSTYGGASSGYTYMNLDGSLTPTVAETTINLPSTDSNQEVSIYLQSLLEDDPSEELYIHNIFFAENQT